ncbi:MAG TPA: xanthine dehydrogenase family protein molybdopterin-binding subunit [Stellaceae bacterium]|jgi:carbon-monoxide dehydrogenase large subunit|nr:xanthine dehydrogenase family protein molybdopterin-binding subunit [Stellaceae bacterium]
MPDGNAQIGRSVRRLEDARFLRGRGRYVEDIDAPAQLHGYVLRSPHGHAEIAAIDTAAARALPGVHGVFTAADLAAETIGPLPCIAQVATVAPMIVPSRHALAVDRVRHVGDPVAFVVADTRDIARDAAELVAVNYRVLPAVIDATAALTPGAALLWDEAPGNLSYRFEKGDKAAVDAAMASAPHVVELDLVNNRLVVAPVETRAAIGQYDRAADSFDLLLSGMGVQSLRAQLADAVFRMPAERIRVRVPDVGGGFGMKNFLYPEYVLVLFAARKLGRPVKWVGERGEDFISSAQGRDNRTKGRLALDADGKFLALEAETIANLGAYMSTSGPGSSTNAPSAAMGGVYDIPAIFMSARGVFTNTVPIDAYRGAGKPEANYLIERLVELAARRLGIDPADLRRRNLINRFPYPKALGTTVDSGKFIANLDSAVERARRRPAARGKLRGLGIACFLETARGAPNEGAEIRFETDGTVSLLLGTQSNGQGHETSYPQIASDLLGLPIETFRFVQADTAEVPRGNGHGGARSMHQGGFALHRAAEMVVAKGRAAAAGLLQADAAALQFADGRFSVPGSGQGIDLLAVARAAADPANLSKGVAPGLGAYVWNECDVITFPNGTHVAEVEIDIETGLVTLESYFAIDDYGRVINPMLTCGQVQGGVAQGIGQAMLEHTVYDPESGQLLSGSLLDYALPRADDLPDLDIVLDGLPTAANPLGVKGSGQAGAIAAPQTIVCAILDALAPLGIEHIDMPATSERVWGAIRAAPRSP